MNALVIREATASDAEAIALLGSVTFTETFGHLFKNEMDLMDYKGRTFSVQKIRTSLQKPNNFYWIAFANELPVGYAKLKMDSPSDFIRSNRVAQLQKIYVLKDFLSLKIGHHDFQIGSENFSFIAMSKKLGPIKAAQ